MSARAEGKIRVMLAEDHVALRDGLKMLLEVEGDIAVVAETEDGRQTVATARDVQPDLVLMDVALLGLDGIEATRQIKETHPGIAVVIVSAHPEMHLVRAALDAGALGYVLKRAGGNELRTAIRTIHSGRPYFSEEVMRVVQQRVRSGRRKRSGPGADPREVLTQREFETLQLVAGGRSNREIAEILGLSIKTIETHRMHLMEKLDIHDVASLTRYAIRKGLIDLEPG